MTSHQNLRLNFEGVVCSCRSLSTIGSKVEYVLGSVTGVQATESIFGAYEMPMRRWLWETHWCTALLTLRQHLRLPKTSQRYKHSLR